MKLHNEDFIKYFNKNAYVEYKQILREIGVITNVPYDNNMFYEPSKYSMQYRVHNNYMNCDDGLYIVVINRREYKKKDEFVLDERLTNLDGRYIDTVQNLEIDYAAAINAEIDYVTKNHKSISQLKSRINRILYLKYKRFIKMGVKVDRIYHSFSNLSKVARKHFKLKFYSVDIVNAQPLLLVSYLKKNKLDCDHSYQAICEAGEFYEQFYDLCGFDRGTTKVAVYKALLFDFKENNKVNKRFKILYPKTWLSLKEIHGCDTSLASGLQNFEASLFNSLVPINSSNYFTLFDAIYCTEYSDIQQLGKKIVSYFRNIGVTVNIAIEK